MNLKKYLPIILVFLLAFSLRVWKITGYPTGLNADEAAIGYNAYSLLKTGKDEFGHPWPINFQSFNDFKPGLYFYLVLPFVKVLGLNELAVRLPSVILGSLTVLSLYFLVKEMGLSLPLIPALLLAGSPWHLQFSRGGWETNAAVFFMVLGTFLFFLALRKPKYLAFSALSFVLSMFTYHSARVVVPLLVFGLLVLYGKKLLARENRRFLLSGLLAGIVPFLVLLFSMTGPAGASRFSGVGILADQGPFWRVNELRGQHANPFSLFPRIAHNRIFEYSLQFLDNYLRHFNGSFLFLSGDEIQRNKVTEMGQLYLADIPFLILGLYFLFRNRPKNWQFVLWWLLAAPTASALTFQSPHAIRALNLVIPLSILTGYGIGSSLIWLKRQRAMVILLCGYMAISYFWNVGFYLHQYYIHTPKTYPLAWEDGFKSLVDYVQKNPDRYEKIYVTGQYDQPYILFAFYLKYPPEKFQKEAKLTPKDKYGFSTVDHFDKYYFGRISAEMFKEAGKVMIVGTPTEIPNSATIVKRIFSADGQTEIFRISQN